MHVQLSTEDGELKTTHEKFPDYEIVHPDTYDDNKEKAAREIEFCKEVVSTCDALAFTRLLGKVTSGVGVEVEHALSLRKPVFEIVNSKIKQIRRAPAYIKREQTNLLSRQ